MKKLTTLLLSLSIATPAMAVDVRNQSEWRFVDTGSNTSFNYYVSKQTTKNTYLSLFIPHEPQPSQGILPDGTIYKFTLKYMIRKGFKDCDKGYILPVSTEVYDTESRLVDTTPNTSLKMLPLLEKDREFFCNGN